MTGERPETCPWRAFQEPLVADVMRAYGLFESGQVEMLIGRDPPAVLVDAIVYYHATVERVRADEREREKRKRDAKRGR